MEDSLEGAGSSEVEESEVGLEEGAWVSGELTWLWEFSGSEVVSLLEAGVSFAQEAIPIAARDSTKSMLTFLDFILFSVSFSGLSPELQGSPW